MSRTLHHQLLLLLILALLLMCHLLVLLSPLLVFLHRLLLPLMPSLTFWWSHPLCLLPTILPLLPLSFKLPRKTWIWTYLVQARQPMTCQMWCKLWPLRVCLFCLIMCCILTMYLLQVVAEAEDTVADMPVINGAFTVRFIISYLTSMPQTWQRSWRPESYLVVEALRLLIPAWLLGHPLPLLIALFQSRRKVPPTRSVFEVVVRISPFCTCTFTFM